MAFYIDLVRSTVQSLDGEALLDERLLATIVEAVLRAVEDREEHMARTLAEQRITRGVSHELEYPS